MNEMNLEFIRGSYILSDVSKEVGYYEEIMGMLPVFLHGDVRKIK